MTASAQPSRQGRAYTRDEIALLLRRALGELLLDGTSFRELSVEKIAAQAGIARSTFYLYFDDKAAMLDTLSAEALLRLYDAQRIWLGKGADTSAADVRAAMRAVFAAFGEDEIVLRAVGEASGYDPVLRQAYVTRIQDYIRAIERFIRKGQQGGWVRDVHPASTAAALAWMTERTISQTGPGASKQRIRATADALADVVCATLLTGH